MRIVDEFKAFAFRGNLLDLAIAFVLGVAFNSVVQALVDGILMQLVAALIGRPDFDSLAFEVNGTPIRYGMFLTALTTFMLIALALFFVMRAVNRMLHPRGAPADPPETRECPLCFTAVPVEASRCPACAGEIEPLRR